MNVVPRRALVTGAGQGVGRGIALALAEQGFDVAVNDLHRERTETVAAELAGAGGRAVAAPFDVTDEHAVAAAIAEVGPVDVLVNNAGIPEGRFTGLFLESSPTDWTPVIDLNVYGSLYCMRAVLPGMSDRGFGRVIQISSGVAARGVPYGRSLYGASKAAIEGAVRHVAVEVAANGVTVNALCLGLISNAADYADPAVVEIRKAATPAGRFGEPWEVGAAVAWLASDAAGFVTGQVIHLNGGAYHGR